MENTMVFGKTMALPPPGLVQAARTFYFAEYVGGVFYRQFAASLENEDIRESFQRFSRDEHNHAEWYADWMRSRNIAVPAVRGVAGFLAPTLRAFLAPMPLDTKLRIFSQTEFMATRHLTALAQKIHDRELRAIVEKTIPCERAHAEWYEREGRRILGK
jgi:rubrerythrin